MLIMKNGKREITVRMELLNQEKNLNPRRKGNIQIVRNIVS